MRALAVTVPILYQWQTKVRTTTNVWKLHPITEGLGGVVHTGFDIVYLFTVITLGITMVRKSREKQYTLYGWMAVVLGCGDAFHLIPRAIALCTTGLESYTAALGIGKMITSVTMTAFYVLLYGVYRERYDQKNRNMDLVIALLAISRIVLCLFPQNAWTSANPPLLWGILCNIPFTILGAVIVVLFTKQVKEKDDTPFRHLALTIILSFGCYLPVVLFAEAVPMVGMLMIPKTCAYVWKVWIGFQAMKNCQK